MDFQLSTLHTNTHLCIHLHSTPTHSPHTHTHTYTPHTPHAHTHTHTHTHKHTHTYTHTTHTHHTFTHTHTGRTSFPEIFFNDRLIGGSDDLQRLEESGQLDQMLRECLDAPMPDFPPPLREPRSEEFLNVREN